MNRLNTILTGAVFALAAGSASATVPLYGDVGHVNTTTYSFTATNTGNVIAYFAGSTARYDETLTMYVNGIATGVVGLDDHTSTVGQSLDFGHVQAGATLTFAINVLTNGDVWSSDEALNSDGLNHIYSTAYDGGGANGIPSGTYVAFEDLAKGHSDLNYHDETFVFTDVSTIATVGSPTGPSKFPPKTPAAPPQSDAVSPAPQNAPPTSNTAAPPPPISAVPEPATWAIMLVGFGGLGGALRARRRILFTNP